MPNNKIAHSFLWKLLERFSSQAISIVVTILLARILMPAEYGVVAIILVFINISNVIIDGGLSTALIQKKDADSTDFSTILLFSMGMAALLYTILFAAAPSVSAFFGNPLLTPTLRVLSINLFFNSFNAVQRAYVSRHMLFNKMFYCSLLATICSGTIGIVMAHYGFGVWALVTQQIVMQVALTGTMWLFIQWRPIMCFSTQRFFPLFNYGWKIFLTNFIIAVYEEIRSLIIGKVYTPASLAFFDRGKQLPNMIMTNINISLQTILLPAFADIQDDPQQVKRIMRRAVEVTNFFIMPLLVILLVSAKPFVLIVLTDKWLGAVPFIQIFCIANLWMPIQSANMSVIKALGYSNITLKLEIVKKVLETVILIVSFMIDVYAVAWGIVVYNVVCLFINLHPSKRIIDYGIAEQLRGVIVQLTIAATMGVAICWIPLLNLNMAIALAAQYVFGFLLYYGMHRLLNTSSYAFVKSIVKQELAMMMKHKSIPQAKI